MFAHIIDYRSEKTNKPQNEILLVQIKKSIMITQSYD